MTTSRYARHEAALYPETLFYKRAVFICIGLIAVFITLYVVALGSTVHYVLARTSYEEQASNLSANLANLQAQYLTASESITLDRGAALGLHATKDVSFVNRTTENGAALSFVDTHEL